MKLETGTGACQATHKKSVEKRPRVKESQKKPSVVDRDRPDRGIGSAQPGKLSDKKQIGSRLAGDTHSYRHTIHPRKSSHTQARHTDRNLDTAKTEGSQDKNGSTTNQSAIPGLK